ncbi:YhgE/Pip family protein [Galbitalea soli]|uniref:ABC transporter permease n=1 Tax=Galbitalea soli TaxID=1268042 RepID=A0A7C9TR29_9MICO|nr:YhgE/Pip family protein [Galbitalea soli]NEM91897.1 ABC transporter permease [Galbitalea soli]NYJ29266.1 putative membrane protein [Galbitalea soli]
MTIVPLVRAEFARLTASRLGIASLIALMTVPIIYGGLYLWGNKDPYGSLSKVPAAIVVADTGSTLDGSPVNYGRDAADSLVSGKRFGWHVVSAQTARAGVTSGRYDFVVTFPAGFSSALTSAGGSTPQTARLELTTNDINSYLSTTLAKQATETIRTTIAQEVAKSASGTLLDAVSSLRSGLVDAQHGSSELASGAATASRGATALASGSASLASGAASLSAGLSTLSSSSAALPASTASLASGASRLSGGLRSLSTAVSGSSPTSLSSATAATAAGAAQLRQQLAAALAASDVPPQTQAQLNAAMGQLAGATAATASGVSGTLAPSIARLSSGSATLASGAATLAARSPQLVAGISTAAAGAERLSSGAASAASGASTLSNGVARIATGSGTLRDSLSSGVARVPATTAAERARTAAILSDPILVKQHAITTAQNYGAGLAPFFISLSAWIGIYALFLLVRPLSRRALTAVARPIRTTLAGWATPALLGVVQMIGLYAVLTLALGLHVANPLGLLAFMALVSVTFAAIVLALNALLGSVGQFLGLVLMIVQLVTAGGTFPWQTLPGPLAVLHQALPMSHAVDGVRQLMYGGAAGDLIAAILPLLGWLVVGLGLTALAARRQGRRRSLTQLRPSAIGG